METTEEKRILLICTAGITSGLLVKNIQNAANEKVYLYMYTLHPQNRGRAGDPKPAD